MTVNIKPRGVIVPLVTPVTQTGELDVEALHRLIDLQIGAGTHGIFLLGTTGEGPSVPEWMQRRVISEAISTIQGRVPVYVGVFGNSLDTVVASANHAFEMGVDAVVLTAPNYYPLTVQELRNWFNRTINRIYGPVLLYNIPATTHCSIPLEIVEEFAAYPSVIGLKDSENDLTRLKTLLERFGGSDQFAILVGVGALMYEGMTRGASGIVPSVGNIIPRVCVEFYEACIAGRFNRARELFGVLNAAAATYQKGRPLGQSLAALKAILASNEWCQRWTLPPILPLDNAESEKVVAEFRTVVLGTQVGT